MLSLLLLMWIWFNESGLCSWMPVAWLYFRNNSRIRPCKHFVMLPLNYSMNVYLYSNVVDSSHHSVNETFLFIHSVYSECCILIINNSMLKKSHPFGWIRPWWNESKIAMCGMQIDNVYINDGATCRPDQEISKFDMGSLAKHFLHYQQSWFLF